jgi:hypothetical protein
MLQNMSEWLAAADRAHIEPRPRRRWHRAQLPYVVPKSAVHAVKETVEKTACGLTRPDLVVGIWPMDEPTEHCEDCLTALDERVRAG